MRAIVASIFAIIKEFIFTLGLWSPSLSNRLEAAISGFIAANTRYWQKQKPGVATILIEGHLSQYGPNYLFRTAVAGLAVQNRIGGDIDVVYNGYRHEWILADKIYNSFGIAGGIHLGSVFFFRNFVYYFASFLLAAKYTLKIKAPRDILDITFGSLKVGDLIYDDVIRNTKRPTIETIDRHVTKAIARSLFHYLQYKKLFSTRPYKYYISTHTAYSQYGLLCRLSLLNGAKVIETSDIQMSLFSTMTNQRLPTYHEGINASIRQAFSERTEHNKNITIQSKKSLRSRLEAEIGQVDVKKAYTGKIYSRRDLEIALGIPENNKIAFILAHVFSDSPHISSGMLYSDYYQWLKKTLSICLKSQGVSWIVKPHPSSDLYNEAGLVEKMISDVASDNIHLCPQDLNTKSLEQCADGIVTVHGTAGLEYSCLGIPTLLAGRAFYSGFGFTIDPESVDAYERHLLTFGDIHPLSSEQINNALLVYGIWDQQFDWKNPIVTSEVLSYVWGNGHPRDLPKAYEVITRNLSCSDPRHLKLWKFAQSCVD